jgi:hypothetical protein
MATITAFQRGQVTRFNLDVLPSWRLRLGATVMHQGAEQVPCLALIMQHPEPLAVQHGGVAQVALAVVTCPLTRQAADLLRVADVGLLGGALDIDLERTREALHLFKNNPQVKGDLLERCVEDAQRLVRAYWEVRQWLAAQGGPLDVTVSETLLQLRA